MPSTTVHHRRSGLPLATVVRLGALVLTTVESVRFASEAIPSLRSTATAVPSKRFAPFLLGLGLSVLLVTQWTPIASVVHEGVVGGGLGAAFAAGLVFRTYPDPIAVVRHTGETIHVEECNQAFETAFEDDLDAIEDEFAGRFDPVARAVRTAIEEDVVVDRIVTTGEGSTDDGPTGDTAAVDGTASVKGPFEPTESTGVSSDSTERYRVRVVSTPEASDGDAYVVFERRDEMRERIEDLEARNERLEAFARTVAHDLRNPLDVVDAHVGAAARSGEISHLETAREAIHRMERLISEVLLLSRRGEIVGDTEGISLAEVATAAWHGVDGDGGSLEILGDARIDADETRLRDLFENLYRNAIDHGRVDDTDAVTVRVVATDDGFAVEDDGRGFDPEVRAAAFEPGVSGTDGGTGLGLAIVSAIASGHGWAVEIGESTAGGARFEFVIDESTPDNGG